MGSEYDTFVQNAIDSYQTTNCSECGAVCADPSTGPGIHLDGAPLCAPCGEKHW